MTDEQRADLQASADVLGCDLLVVPEGCEAAFGSFLRAALGGGPRRDGPPYEHRHRLPETEEELAAEPFLPSLTVEHEGNGPAHDTERKTA